MKMAAPRERRDDEPRCAVSPETVKKFTGLGAEVIVEAGVGAGSDIPDALFADAGAKVVGSLKDCVGDADVALMVRRPTAEVLKAMKKGAALVCTMAPYDDRETVEACAKAGIDAFALEFMPRITRAQSMDVLSSQSNLAGYKAVVDAAGAFRRALPMMMTAAGTVPAARVFVMGAGVAGLQAIATAKRLGAVVTATDVRPATKEQVESLGGKFVAVEDEEFKQAETAGGYAKEMSDEYKAKQAKLVADHIAKQDIVITTALIPGRPAPTLVTEDMVKSMRPGSVVYDLAAERGGNCAVTKPGETVVVHGVTIMGPANIPGALSGNASLLFAKNILNFLTPFIDKESKSLKMNWDDEVVKGTGLTRGGEIVHPALTKN